MGRSIKTLAIVTFPEQSYPDNPVIYSCNKYMQYPPIWGNRALKNFFYSFKKFLQPTSTNKIDLLLQAKHHGYGKVGTEFYYDISHFL